MEMNWDLQQPYIQLKYTPSEDIRDDLFDIFLNKLHGESQFFITTGFRYDDTPDITNGRKQTTTMNIYPVSSAGMGRLQSFLSRLNRDSEAEIAFKPDERDEIVKRIIETR